MRICKPEQPFRKLRNSNQRIERTVGGESDGELLFVVTPEVKEYGLQRQQHRTLRDEQRAERRCKGDLRDIE